MTQNYLNQQKKSKRLKQRRRNLLLIVKENIGIKEEVSLENILHLQGTVKDQDQDHLKKKKDIEKKTEVIAIKVDVTRNEEKDQEVQKKSIKKEGTIKVIITKKMIIRKNQIKSTNLENTMILQARKV